MSEDNKIDTVIWRAKATDEDTSSQISYRMLPGLKGADSDTKPKPESDMFEINPETGVVFLRKKLDFEMRNEYVFTVEANDGENSGAMVLYIMVTDVNDDKPYWESNLQTHFTLEENVPGDFRVGQFKAVDRDNAARLRYKVLSTEPIEAAAWFTLHPFSGLLTSATEARASD